MTYKALYREWRPQAFKDMVEQEHIVKTLKNSVKNNRIAHAYLFCGTRGTGKTTTAKIFSRAINCLNPQDGDPCNECEVCLGLIDGSLLDVLEIDAASNNSVDNVRQIRDEVAYASAKARYKVYIIDEVHMLSTGAFNALLKTLEEPPEHVVFILATTDPHKLPVTVLSRCQRFDFRRISVESIMDRLKMIAGSGGVEVEEPALRLLARLADGALRDGISLLDQCIGLGKSNITYEDVLEVAGILEDEFVGNLIDAIDAEDTVGIVKRIDELTIQGKDLQNVVADLIAMYRNIYLCRLLKDPSDVIHLSQESIERMQNQCKNTSEEMLTLIIKELSGLESSIKWALSPKIMLEVCLIGLATHRTKLGRNNLEARLIQLEEKLNRGEFSSNLTSTSITASNKSRASAATNSSESNTIENNSIQNKNSSRWEAPKQLNGNLEDIKSIPEWREVLSELRKNNKPSLVTLLDGSKAVFVDENTIGVYLSDEMSNMTTKIIVQKPENRELIEEALANKLGKVVGFKCFEAHEGYAAPPKKVDPFMEKVNEFAKRADGIVNIIEE